MAQSPACTAGTMANVEGTSCSIGNITFNFQNDFDFNVTVIQNNVIDFHVLSPATVGFIPIQNGNQFGFQLVMNVIEGPGDPFFLSTHNFNFSYLPQANPGAAIRGESLALDAAIQNPGSQLARVLAADNQCYSNGIFEPLFPQLFSQPGTAINDPAQSILLEVPSLQAVACFPGVTTTTVQSIATGPATARLTSATFLYTVDPQAAPPALAHLRYSNIDLPGAAETDVSSINNAGRLVGSVLDANGVFHGFVTGGNDGVSTFDFPGAAATFPQGLNEHGDIVGTYIDDAGKIHAFLLQDGTFSNIDFPGAVFNSAIGINNQGEVAGLFLKDHQVFGYILANGTFTLLDHSPDTPGRPKLTQAIGISNRGEVVGSFFDPDTMRGFKFFQGVFTDFDVPGQGDTFPEGMSNIGDNVGTYTDSDFVIHGYVENSGSFATVEFPGSGSTIPLGINAPGRIVGIYTDADGAVHSFLAEPQPDDGQKIAPSKLAQPNQGVQLPTCGGPEWQKHPERIRRPCKPSR
ncbi:MAG: hypothetical protein LAO76_22540 [Acidobacteriia bacterium]|nr:hypothetical protein [Terriglobia bacterium]